MFSPSSIRPPSRPHAGHPLHPPPVLTHGGLAQLGHGLASPLSAPHGPPQGPCDEGIEFWPSSIPALHGPQLGHLALTITARSRSLARLPCRVVARPRPRGRLSRPPVAPSGPQQGTTMPSTAPPRPAPRRSFSSHRDRDGRTIISVALSNFPGVEAQVYVEDFCRIITDHGWGAWFVNKRTTRAPAVLLESRTDRRQHLVARLVMREPRGRMVEPVDGDLLNLRRSNLVATPGGRGGQRKADSKAHAEPAGGDPGAEAAFVA